MSELVSNAIEYAGGRTLLIAVHPAARRARIAVTDRYFTLHGNFSCLQRGGERTVNSLISVHVEMGVLWPGSRQVGSSPVSVS
ncbi:hypothetical protein ACQP1G_10700 [Nocardia sp. CA-107356]|uniref:hypothetical protein n=1 Tax=Nocardia sp. CA-107356 TaxID=3239972 RepID=UPI003D926A32